ncbi:MAG: radical SAM protein [Helicobacter sp.]|nr:radical SAM protein [Helicobacter sp.]
MKANESYILEKVSNSVAGGGALLDDFLQFPRYIQLETINRCNARCAMCAIEEWDREDKYMNDDLFHRISNELINHSNVIERVSIFMGGEALLDKKLESRIKKLSTNGIQNIYFTTNASLLDATRAKEILESGVTQVDISIDSLNKEIYEKIRVNLKFDVVLENTLRFIKLRNAGDYKTRIRIRITEMLCNRDEVESMEEFWNGVLDSKRGDAVYSKRLNTKFTDTNISKNASDFIGMKEYKQEAFDCNAYPCYALWNTSVILSDGRVGMCCVDMGRSVIFGDLKTQTLQDVWQNSKALLKMRQVHLQGGRGCIAVCENCDTWV